MSDLLELIKSRRSCRNFTDEPVSDSSVEEFLEAARWAPSGGNIQSWFFGVIRDRKKIKEIKVVSPGLIGNPSIILALCIDKDYALKKGGVLGRDVLSVADICMAAQNIMLVAYDKGIGTCAVKSFHTVSVAKVLKLPEHIEPELLIYNWLSCK